MEQPYPILFEPAIKIDDGQSVGTKEMKNMMLDGIMKEDFLKEFQQDFELQTAIEKLKQNIL